MNDLCIAPLCDREPVAKGICDKHRMRVRRGNPLLLPDEQRFADELDRLREGVRRIADECAADIPEDGGNATANHIARHLRALLGDQGASS